MRITWNVTKLADAPIEIVDGDRGKNYPQHTDFMDNGFCLFLNAGNVTNSGFSFNNLQFITAEKDEMLRKGKLHRNDVVLTTRGTIGNAAYYDEKVPFEHVRINSGMVILRCDQNHILPSFVYHYLRSPSFHAQVNAFRSGVAQPQLPIRDMRQIEVPVPTLIEQQRIANLISAYDDLIENNRRRIQLLEESARLLYKEWFVYLRFPGHEHVKVLNGVPEGWEKKKISDVAKINSKSLKNGFHGTIEYIDIASVSPGKIDETLTIDFKEAPSRARRIVQHGDIIWSCVRPNRGSHAIIWNPKGNLIASTGFAVLCPEKVPTSYLYQFTTTPAFVGYLSNNAKGVAYPAVSAKDFEDAGILVPSASLLLEFDEVVRPIIDMITQLNYQNKKLKQARDLLLPRLMNGEIEV